MILAFKEKLVFILNYLMFVCYFANNIMTKGQLWSFCRNKSDKFTMLSCVMILQKRKTKWRCELMSNEPEDKSEIKVGK